MKSERRLIAAIALLGAVCVGGRVMWIFSGAGPSQGADSDAVIVSTGTVAPGMTLTHIVQEARLPSCEWGPINAAIREVIDPRRLRCGDRYEIVRSTSGQFRRLTLRRDLMDYSVERSSAGYVSAKRAIPLTLTSRIALGTLESSVWESMTSRGIDPETILQFADVFAWDIDFNVEPRPGDRFALHWEERKTPGGRVAERQILGALYDGRTTGRRTAVFFENDHYDEDGNSHHRAFLKAPLSFRRISSRFSRRRFHPILRYFRPHLGIDYAAPMGTPVNSVGDGTVIAKGWKGGFGRYVEVRHNGIYTSCYGHLSRYAAGLSLGGRVKQGQVIGYVGSSGLSTGPHLDFRLRKNGAYVNFLALKLPPEKRIPPSRMAEFKSVAIQHLRPLEERLAAGTPHAEESLSDARTVQPRRLNVSENPS